MRVVQCCAAPTPEDVQDASTVLERDETGDAVRWQKAMRCRLCGAVQEGPLVDRREQREKVASGEWHVVEDSPAPGWATIVEAPAPGVADG